MGPMWRPQLHRQFKKAHWARKKCVFASIRGFRLRWDLWAVGRTVFVTPLESRQLVVPFFAVFAQQALSLQSNTDFQTHKNITSCRLYDLCIIKWLMSVSVLLAEEIPFQFSSLDWKCFNTIQLSPIKFQFNPVHISPFNGIITSLNIFCFISYKMINHIEKICVICWN